MKIKKGDTVQIITGKDRGKQGKVVRVIPDEERVVVEGINIAKRHRRAQQQGQESGIVEKPAPIHVSNVMLLDPTTKVPTRVGYQIEGDKKIRISKKTHKEIK